MGCPALAPDFLSSPSLDLSLPLCKVGIHTHAFGQLCDGGGQLSLPSDLWEDLVNTVDMSVWEKLYLGLQEDGGGLPTCLHTFPSSLSSDYLFKLLLIGDSGVGKSCLLLRFAVSKKSPIPSFWVSGWWLEGEWATVAQ